MPSPVSPPPDSLVVIDWTAIFDNAGPNTAAAMVGDTVTFTWSGNHNVYESASMSDYDGCVKTGGIMQATTAVFTWSFTATTAGTRYFICEVGSHCNGALQKVAITISDGTPASPPSASPSPPAAVALPPPPASPSQTLASADPCFPSAARVTLPDGSTTRMDALRHGDELLAVTASGEVGTDVVSVLSIAKPEATQRAFVRLVTDGNASLILTPEHHLPVGASCCGVLKQATDLELGETVWAVASPNHPHEEHARAPPSRVSLQPHTIVRLHAATHDGLHSPVLARGGLPIVDGVVTAPDRIEVLTLASYGLPLVLRACEATGTCHLLRRAVVGRE